ncbi:hypothetical protein BDV40DRAFT_282473 [Aspergillus tamarii]|uniref:Uncharacterized protein n=1 Tax=Aspergillus tamarii TaxID=41984 RepID=A0A5N6UBJ4_ASPTM|nr:hypothetical protein BDV40DRAFT_282473 [Aspergillus tamarii]
MMERGGLWRQMTSDRPDKLPLSSHVILIQLPCFVLSFHSLLSCRSLHFVRKWNRSIFLLRRVVSRSSFTHPGSLIKTSPFTLHDISA